MHDDHDVLCKFMQYAVRVVLFCVGSQSIHEHPNLPLRRLTFGGIC